VQQVQQPGAAEDDEANDDNRETSAERSLKRKRSGQISEKGMQHIIRISRFISEKEKEITIDGLVNDIPLNLLPDFRGEFNVITRKALELIENKNGSLRRIYDTKSIPSYLRNERKIRFKVVGINIEVKFEKTYEEAVVIQHNKPYIIVGRHVCKKRGLKIIAQDISDDFQLTKWNKKRSATEMTKLYAKCIKNYETSTKSKERRSKERGTSNEPTKEGRHPSEPKSEGDDVEIIEVKEKPKSADPTEKGVESAIREKSIPSENISQKVIENAKNAKIKRASTEIESVRDSNKKALNYNENSQKTTKEQLRDNKVDAYIENKKNCVLDSVKNINELSEDLKVQKSANEQFKNIKSNREILGLSASEQVEIVQCEPNSSSENTNSHLTQKINFLNRLNLITSTPINGNLNKTYTIEKEVNLKQDLLDSILKNIWK